LEKVFGYSEVFLDAVVFEKRPQDSCEFGDGFGVWSIYIVKGLKVSINILRLIVLFLWLSAVIRSREEGRLFPGSVKNYLVLLVLGELPGLGLDEVF
jgi:hypothetical protein